MRFKTLIKKIRKWECECVLLLLLVIVLVINLYKNRELFKDVTANLVDPKLKFLTDKTKLVEVKGKMEGANIKVARGGGRLAQVVPGTTPSPYKGWKGPGGAVASPGKAIIDPRDKGVAGKDPMFLGDLDCFPQVC